MKFHTISVLKKRFKVLAVVAGAVMFLGTQSVFGGELNAGEETVAVVNLTEEERAFVESLPALVVGCQGNADPLMYETKSGEFGGIARDILDTVAERTGLTFQYKVLPVGNITYDALRAEGLDLVAGIEYNSVNSHVFGLHLTEPYFEAGKVVVCRKETKFAPDASMKIAVASGSQTIKTVIRNKYPNFQVERYLTVEEAMDAVDRGDVDGMIQNQYSVDRLMHRPKYEDLRIVAAAGIGDSHSLSPLIYKYGNEEKDEVLSSPLLMSVLNKGIDSLTEEETSLFVIRQTMERGYNMTVGDLLYKYRVTLLALGISLGAFVGLGGYIWRIRFLKKSVKLLKREEEKHQLLLEKTEQIIYEVDLVKMETRTSGAFEKKFGWNPVRHYSSMELEEAIGSWRVHQDDQESFSKAWRQSLEKGQDSQMEVRLLKTDGSCVWCRINNFVMLGEDGEAKLVLGLIRDVNQETAERQKLAEKSRRDYLTGLYNKEAFEEESRKWLLECRKRGKNCALLFVDLDNFKNVNDHLGHLTGDRAICDVAEILREFFQEDGIVSRFGGDEFCIFIPCDETDASKEAKLQKLLEALCLSYSDGVSGVEISASVGVALSKVSGYNWDILLRHADAALYRAKETGKNRFNFYVG